MDRDHPEPAMAGAQINMAETVIDDERWRSVFPDPGAIVEQWRRRVADRLATPVGAMAVLMTDDETVRDLNRRFRKIDAPTNVLSFPASADGGDRSDPSDDVGFCGDPGFCGDIAIAYDTCAREAADKLIPPSHHSAHLIVHGILHLIGFDHETEEDADEMEDLERQILAQAGIPDPYNAVGANDDPGAVAALAPHQDGEIE